MAIKLDSLKTEPRLLIEVQLQPLQGTRFQPTNFPDLGPATYAHQGSEMLLVESAQSMANRMEAVCWDSNERDGKGAPISVLSDLPYVSAELPDGRVVSSITESHRLNSPYFVVTQFQKQLCDAVGFEKGKPWRMQNLARHLFSIDPNSLLHGVFFSNVQDGRLRLPRCISAFIEATLPGKGDGRVESGFTRREESDPTGVAGGKVLDGVSDASLKSLGYDKPGDYRKKLKDNVKNIIGPRTEFTGNITAFFNVDLAQLRGYGLPPEAEKLLIALSLFKIQKVLRDGLRLRTACDLEPAGEIVVKRPSGFVLPDLASLENELPTLIKAAAGHFAKDSERTVTYEKA